MYPKASLLQKTTASLKIISLGLLVGFGIQFAQAWTNPTLPAPDGNIAGPLTMGIENQGKSGGLALGGSLLVSGSIFGAGSTSNYGALTMQGSKNGYSGINFKDASGVSAGTLMMHPGYSGFYNASTTGWRWYVDDAGNSYQPGKAVSASTVTADPGNTMVTKDYVDSQRVMDSPSAVVTNQSITLYQCPRQTGACSGSAVFSPFGGGGTTVYSDSCAGQLSMTQTSCNQFVWSTNDGNATCVFSSNVPCPKVGTVSYVPANYKKAYGKDITPSGRYLGTYDDFRGSGDTTVQAIANTICQMRGFSSAIAPPVYACAPYPTNTESRHNGGWGNYNWGGQGWCTETGVDWVACQ